MIPTLPDLRRWFVWVSIVLALVATGCASSAAALHPIARQPTTTPTALPPPTLVARVAPPTPTTVIVRPTASPSPTIRARATATATRGETATPLIVPRPTRVKTLTPDNTPTPEDTFAPTPSLTVEPTLPTSRAVTISRGPTTENVVALTFDAGADRGQAAQLLAYLEASGINVTFGITGRWAESNPDLVRRIVADGDELMNHTYDHLSFTGLSAKPAVLGLPARVDEITKADSVVQTIAGVSPKPFFRPPYGDQDPGVLQAVALAGYRYSVLWTIDSFGWRGFSVPQIVDRCLRLAEPGAIYVLHVGSLSQDVEATPAIVLGLRSRGFRFVTLDQMFSTPSN